MKEIAGLFLQLFIIAINKRKSACVGKPDAIPAIRIARAASVGLRAVVLDGLVVLSWIGIDLLDSYVSNVNQC